MNQNIKRNANNLPYFKVLLIFNIIKTKVFKHLGLNSRTSTILIEITITGISLDSLAQKCLFSAQFQSSTFAVNLEGAILKGQSVKKTLFWLASACTLALLLSSCSEVKPKAQDKKTPDLKTSETTENPQASSSILLMSYNLYNFFDTQHDEGKNDYGFLSKEICKEKEEERFSRCTKSCERETEKRDMKLKGEFKTAEGKEKKNYDVELSLSDEKYKETDEKKCKKKCRDDKNKDIKRYCVDWNQEKYLGKLNQLKKVFDLRKSTSEESTYPDIVGFVEIENERVAKDIASLLGYKNQVTTNGPDNRGIDVALLYNTSDDLK